MRHSLRHTPYAVSTVLGLAAPALAALLLTSSTPGLAAGPPSSLPGEVAAPVVHEVDAAAAAAPHRVVAAAKAAPVVHRTVTFRPAARRTAVATAPAVRKPVAPKPTTRTVSQTAQPAGVDDYPFKSRSFDNWSFTARQCVSFAAWRLHEHGHDMGANAGASWGSAYNWDSEARAKGDAVTTTAHVGAVAQWNAGESSAYYSPGSARPNGSFVAGGYGHVGWVKTVYADGSALVEQYNMGGSQAYSVMRVKAPRYIVF